MLDKVLRVKPPIALFHFISPPNNDKRARLIQSLILVCFLLQVKKYNLDESESESDKSDDLFDNDGVKETTSTKTKQVLLFFLVENDCQRFRQGEEYVDLLVRLRIWT